MASLSARSIISTTSAEERSSSDSDGGDSQALRRSKREALQEHGVEAWASHHSYGLFCSLILAVALLAWPSYALRLEQRRFEQQELEEVRRRRLSMQAPPSEGDWETRFHLLGCYPMRHGDQLDAPKLRDLTCMSNGSHGVPCRSGLPFYRMALMTEGGQRAPVSWRLCASFCTFKGFDISGVVQAVECRCGATQANAGVWHGVDVMRERIDLLWQPPWEEVPKTDPRCAIVAARYTKELPIRGLSFDRTHEDVVYVRSIIEGGEVGQGEPVRAGEGAEQARQALPPQAAKQLRRRLVEEEQEPPAEGEPLRSCKLGRCASGLPWPIRAEFKKTGVPFCIDGSNVNEETQRMIYAVIADLSRMTCVRFNEVSPFYNRTRKIQITGGRAPGAAKNALCSTSYVGYPVNYGVGGGYGQQDTKIWMGTCVTEQEKGSFLHELGHALGMNHEQTRPDRDKYVQINWAAMRTDAERQQYALDPDGYVGSPLMGPVEYDYESIMHYPKTPQMQTLPLRNGNGIHDSVIGQRQQLSAGDVMQLRNMYSCDVSHMNCVDDDEGLRTWGPFAMPEGMGCKDVVGYCEDALSGEAIRYYCAKSCEACPEDWSKEVVVGCQDATGFETVCERYRDYCPGRVPGYEQFMMEKCRKSCHIEQFCGTTTTPRQYTTTTATPQLEVAAPETKVRTVQVDFDIVGGGYDLKQAEQRAQLRSNFMQRASDTFGTAVSGELRSSDGTSGSTLLKVQCGCGFEGGCKMPCSQLDAELDRMTAGGPELWNQELRERGMSGLQVTSLGRKEGSLASMETALDHPTTKAAFLFLGGVALALALGLLGFYLWLSSEAGGKSGPYD